MKPKTAISAALLSAVLIFGALHFLRAAQTTPGTPFGRGPFRELPPEQIGGPLVRGDETLASEATHDEWPALAAGPEDRVALVWVAFDDTADHLVVAQGTVDADGALKDLQRETLAGPGAFVMPAAAYDTAGNLWVVWCGRAGEAFDLFARRYAAGQGWGKTLRLTDDAMPDACPVLVDDADGGMVLVWQGRRGKSFDIFAAQLTETGLRDLEPVTRNAANDWSPAAVGGGDGALHVAWETYRNGSYDLYLRTRRNGQWSAELPVAATPAKESHPSLACSPEGTVWVAYDVGEENWGRHVRLHDKRTLKIKGVRGDRVGAFPKPVQFDLPASAERKQEWPHLGIDSAGRLWLTFQRYTAPRPKPKPNQKKPPKPKGLFLQYAASFEGVEWSKPVALMPSSGRTHDRGRLAILSSGRAYVAWASDERQLPYDEIGLVGNIRAAVLPAPETERHVNTYEPTDLAPPIVTSIEPDPIAKRPRQRRVKLGGRDYLLVFGDTHRHTDLSRCNYRGDGTLEAAYRYAIDVGGLDYLAVSDHDQDVNGWRCEEPRPAFRKALWWRSEKCADLHTVPGQFLALYGYERGRTTVDGGGHKNVLYAQRGLPVISVNPQADFFKALTGKDAVVIPHQLADGTDATDWSKWSSQYERVAEIYQARGSYEGLPGGRQAAKKLAGHTLNAAYEAGVRAGIIASSDHGLTHGAYAGTYVTEFTRPAILDALRNRRTFGSTELMEVQAELNGRPMGTEPTLDRQPTIRAAVTAYEPLARVEVIRDGAIVFTREAQGTNAEFTFTDTALTPDQETYYYVRVRTAADAVAWASPWWVTYRP